ncbi:MAG: hypothetical protein JXR73_17885 [Candidatus Omnitrophica bacterium]|nr:hypothetical protein [Candidatus Omnitrophota bacterium]
MSENSNESDSRPPSRPAGKSGRRWKLKYNRRAAASDAKRGNVRLSFWAAIIIYVQFKSLNRLSANHDIPNLIFLFLTENRPSPLDAVQGMRRFVPLGGM